MKYKNLKNKLQNELYPNRNNEVDERSKIENSIRNYEDKIGEFNTLNYNYYVVNLPRNIMVII